MEVPTHQQLAEWSHQEIERGQERTERSLLSEVCPQMLSRGNVMHAAALAHRTQQLLSSPSFALHGRKAFDEPAARRHHHRVAGREAEPGGGSGHAKNNGDHMCCGTEIPKSSLLGNGNP